MAYRISMESQWPTLAQLYPWLPDNSDFQYLLLSKEKAHKCKGLSSRPVIDCLWPFLTSWNVFSVRNIHFTTSSYCLFIDYSPRATLRRSSLILKYRLVRYVSRPNSRLPSTPIATHWDGETLSSSCSNQYPVPTADVVYDTPVVIFSIWCMSPSPPTENESKGKQKAASVTHWRPTPGAVIMAFRLC